MAPPIPSVSLTIKDGGLGIVSSDASRVTFLVGTSSLGTAGNFYSYGGSSVSQIATDLGVGPLAAQAAKHLLKSSGSQVICYKVAASTAGSSSAVTRSGGSSGPLVTLSGAPNDQYDSIVTIVAGGAVGTATFKYSLDGGDTYSETLATAATYLLPSGVTVAFPAGTYVAAETYSWTDTAPSMTSGDIGTAMDAITASSYQGRRVHILGQASSAANALTIATLLQTKVEAAHAGKKYIYAIFESPAVDKASLISTFSGLDAKFVVGCAGFAEVIEDSTNRIQKRSSGRCIVPRVARNPISVHCARNSTDSDLDALTDVSQLVPSGAVAASGYHDEEKTPGLNAARFSTLRTITGRPGFFITNGLTFASSTSDFQQVQYVEIMLAAAEALYAFGLTQLGVRVRKDAQTGYILEAFAAAFDSAAEAALRAALGDAVTGVRVLINRTDDLTSDPTLRAKVRLVVDGYALEFNPELGFADSLDAAA